MKKSLEKILADALAALPEALVPADARAVTVAVERTRDDGHGDFASNLALRLASDPADSGDIVQDVFLKVFRNIHTFRGQSSLRTWIYRIAVNEAHNRRRWIFRHKHNEVGLEDDRDETPHERELANDGPSPFDCALNEEKHALIEQALSRINPSFREAVVLRDIEDLNYEEIAEVLNISMGTVKSRILRGREALRGELAASLRPASLTPQLARHRS